MTAENRHKRLMKAMLSFMFEAAFKAIPEGKSNKDGIPLIFVSENDSDVVAAYWIEIDNALSGSNWPLDGFEKLAVLKWIGEGARFIWIGRLDRPGFLLVEDMIDEAAGNPDFIGGMNELGLFETALYNRCVLDEAAVDIAETKWAEMVADHNKGPRDGVVTVIIRDEAEAGVASVGWLSAESMAEIREVHGHFADDVLEEMKAGRRTSIIFLPFGARMVKEDEWGEESTSEASATSRALPDNADPLTADLTVDLSFLAGLTDFFEN